MITVSEESMVDESKRVFAIQELISQGLKKYEIIHAINTSQDYGWGLDDAEISELVTLAEYEILNDATFQEADFKAKLLAKYEFNYKKLIETKKYRDAVDVVDKMANLMIQKTK